MRDAGDKLKGQNGLTLFVYDRIKEMMLHYDIVPGQRLVFVDLAKQLNVSRTPVNNALCILAKEGYLDFVPNQGYSVHRLTRKEARNLYEIREVLEVGTIGKAIRQTTDDKLEILKQRKLDYKNAVKDRVHRGLFILDTEFHAAIIEMIDNSKLAAHYRDVCQKIFLRFRVENLRIKRIREIVVEHEALYDAILIKDVERAKGLIRAHNENAQRNLFALIFE